MATQKLHLPIVIEQDEDGIFIISCPVFKGCHTQGSSVEEGMERIQEVIELCLEEQRLHTLNRFIGFRELEMNVAI